MKVFAWLITATLFMAPAAWAHNCPNLMAEIDAILESMPDLDEETIVDEDLNKSVKVMRAEGEQLHNDGDHGGSVELLEKALELLKESSG